MEAKCKNKSAVQVELWNVLVNIYVTLIKALSFLISFANDLKHYFCLFQNLESLSLTQMPSNCSVVLPQVKIDEAMN